MSNTPDHEAIVERTWLADSLACWVRTDDHAVLVVGGPGSGKTVALSELIRRNPVLAAHFCRARDDRLINPLRLVEHLSATIASASPAFAAALLRDPLAGRSVEIGDVTMQTGAVASGAVVAGLVLTVGGVSAREAFDRFVRRPWDETADADLPAARLVVVDALDESLLWPGTETVASLLAAVVGTPPRGMRFVVSARPLPDLLAAFRLVRRLDLDAHPEEADADVRRLVARHGVPDFEGVVRAAAGNLLVAEYLVRSPGLAGSSAATGLHQVYREFVDRDLRRDPRRWRDVLRPVVATLGVLRGAGATAPEIAVLANLPVPATRDALADAAAFTRCDAAGRWRVYHESFRDYLVADDEIGAGPEQDLVVAEHLLDRYGPDWWHCEMPYAVEHVAGHLLAALGEAGPARSHIADRLAELVSDARWLVRRVSLDDAEQLLADLAATSHLDGAALRRPQLRAAAAVVSLQAAQLRACAGSADDAEATRLAQQLALGTLSVTARAGSVRLRATARALAEELGEPYVDAVWLRGPTTTPEALRLVIPAHDDFVTGLAVAPDGSRAWSVGADGRGRLWDLANGASLLTVDDVTHLAVAWVAGVVFVVDRAGGVSRLDPVTGHRERLRTDMVAVKVQVSGDGRRLLLAGMDRVVLLDPTSGLPLLALPTPADSGVAATPDLTTVAVVAPGRLSVTRADGASWIREDDTGWSGNPYAESIAISDDGRVLAWSAFPGDRFFVAACRVDGLDARWTRTFSGVVRVAVDPGGAWVAVCTEADDRMYVLDAATGAELLDRPIPSGFMNTRRIPLPNGDVFAASSTGWAHLLPTDAAREPVALSGQSGITALAASSDGRVGASGGTEGSVRVWDLERATAPVTAPEEPRITGVVPTADASGLWVSDVSGAVRLLTTANGLPIREHILGSGPYAVHGCAPDGSTLVVARPVPDDRLEVLVADAGTGAVRERFTIDDDDNRVEGAWWVGGRWLVGVSGSGCELREADGTMWPPGARSFDDVRAVAGDRMMLGEISMVLVDGMPLRESATFLVDSGGNPLRTFPVAPPFLRAYASQAITVSGDGGTAVIANDGLHLLDLHTGQVRTLPGPAQHRQSLVLDHNGRRLVAVSGPETVVLDTATGATLRHLPRPPGGPRLAVSAGPGPQWMCLTTDSGHVVVGALDDPRQLWTCWLDAPLTSIVTVDGMRVVGMDYSNRVLVLRLTPRRRP